MSAKSLWTPIGEKEIKKWRKDLPEGHSREGHLNTAVHKGEGWDRVESDGDTVTFDADIEEESPFVNPIMERDVAEMVYGMIWEWAQTSPEAYQLAIQVMKTTNPDAYSHMSNDELQTVLQAHAEDASRKSTETVYEKNREDRKWGVSH